MQSAESELVKAELEHCCDDFVYFCEQYVWVEDKESQQPIRLTLYECQKRVARQLVAGDWLWVLKARRLGLTWLLAAYAVWLITCKLNRSVCVLNQSKEYAQDFLDRVRFILDKLPAELSHERGIDSKTRLQLLSSGGEVRSLACTKRAIRSLAADLVIFDEGAYMDLLKTARMAAQPAVETSNGQIVGISTSSGPAGDFYEVWEYASAGKSRFKPVFLHWKEHPKRDAAWYERTRVENASDPLYMKREYPATPEEAFESATGRVYPLFVRSDKFIKAIAVHADWKRYRAIDFGGVDPFVCLWGAVVPGDGSGLTVSPDCPNLIRELLAYSYDEKGAPLDENNHACDALRYMVITPGLNGIVGHLHIYREMYVPNSSALGLSLPDLARRIMDESHEMRTQHTYHMGPIAISEPVKYELTVADRSRPDSITLLNQMGIRPCGGQKHLQGGRGGEIEQGIARVNALICGSAKGAVATQIPRMTYPTTPSDQGNFLA